MVTAEGRNRAVCMAALAALILAGCAEGPVRHGSEVFIQGTLRSTLAVPAHDGIELAAIVQQPQAIGPEGLPARWPVVVFLHGWGGAKEEFEADPGPLASAPDAAPDRLREFALAGFIAVAYDARGFGASGGQATVAGTAEMRDLAAVIDAVHDQYPTTGKTGLVGASYGAGQSLQAWASHDVDAVAAHYGWDDLYDGLLPGNVPKLEWAQMLYLYGLPGARGEYSPMVHRWYQNLYTRSGLDTMKEEMQARSLMGRSSPTPLLLCQGMQESLFPHIDRLMDAAGGPVKAVVYEGGHGTADGLCWSRTLDWMRAHLRGEDVGSAAWPLLEAVDAVAKGSAQYAEPPAIDTRTYWMRFEELVAQPSQSTVTITQALSTNPLTEPAGLADRLGPPRPVPEALRNDPNAKSFTTAALGPTVLFGAPVLTMQAPNATVPFQVAAQLQLVTGDGSIVTLGHAAFAATEPAHIQDGQARLEFPWLKATVGEGERLRLVVASNDATWFMALLEPYVVTFEGENRFEVPVLA